MDQIKILINGEKWYEALNFLLKNGIQNEGDVIMKSLLCRFLDNYALEKFIVEQCHFDIPYINKRRKWHSLNFFDQLVPRPPFISTNEFLPKQETLNKLCFVTGGDSNYFEFIVECIESIQNTAKYKYVDICVLDCGLKDDERNYLITRLNVKKIIQRDWAVDFEYLYYINMKRKAKEGLCYQTVMNSLFLYEDVPQYDYYFWIQPDGWVQDENVLDKFIKKAEVNGYAFSRVFHWPFKKAFYFESIPINYAIKNKISDYPLITSGIWCVNKNFLIKWSNIFQGIVREIDFWLGSEEISACLSIDQSKMDYLVSDNYVAIAHIPFCKKFNPYVLYHSKSLKEIGYYTLPAFIVKNSTIHTNKENKNCRNLNNHYHNIKEIDEDNKTEKIISGSLRYRVWPWQDKVQIKQKLLQIGQNNLSCDFTGEFV